MSLMKTPSASEARAKSVVASRYPERAISAIALPMLAHTFTGSRRRGFPLVARRWSPEPFDRRERHEGRCTATRGAAKRVCAVQRWRKEISLLSKCR